jgi:hypothetical protein
MLPVVPAVRGVVMPETRSGVAFTTTPVWVPVSDAVAVSVAVTDQVPGVSRITFATKTWVPLSAAVKV